LFSENPLLWQGGHVALGFRAATDGLLQFGADNSVHMFAVTYMTVLLLQHVDDSGTSAGNKINTLCFIAI
jgi:hypothetical protein